MKRIFLISIIVAMALGFGAITVGAAEFSDWSPPVNLGPVVNSPYTDSCVAISKNGLSLFFSSNRQTGDKNSPDRDLYVSKRHAIHAPWGAPEPLTMLNSTGYWDSCPALSLDEHLLYFTSTRPDGCSQEDIWVSRRHDRRDDFGWQPPVNLGCDFNSAWRDLTPTFFEDEAGRVLMYFCSNRPDGTAYHIYQSEMRDDDTFGPATLVPELNSPYSDLGVTVRRDGLEIIFLSNRPQAERSPWGLDFWKATRASTSDPWSEPEYVSSLNPAYATGRIALSFDGRELYYTSFPPEGSEWWDLWVAKREKLRCHKEHKENKE
jgi:hypothetical protein